MSRARIALIVLLILGIGAVPAFADATVFLGTGTTPANRRAQGVAVGVGLLIVGFEFEYASIREDEKEDAPGLRTGMGNVLLQTPFMIMGIQPYFTAGGGMFREELGTHQETWIGLNTGGGVKFSLIGPLRGRVDYRVFKLGGDALESPTHRLYAGLNLKF